MIFDNSIFDNSIVEAYFSSSLDRKVMQELDWNIIRLFVHQQIQITEYRF